MENLRKNFERLVFTSEHLEKIMGSFSLKEYKRNDLFVQEGKVSRYLGFIESGMFQYFAIKDGEEKTSYVSLKNSFLCSVLSFVGETPARESVRALTDGTVSQISRSDLKKLANEVPGFKDFYIGLLEQTICGIDSTRHDLIMMTADQRYEKMLREEPHLLQEIPLQHLASILGVTPRHLSRIRNNFR